MTGAATEFLLTDHNSIGEDEELDVGGERTEHQASCHHYPAEDGHGPSAEVVHAYAADRT